MIKNIKLTFSYDNPKRVNERIVIEKELTSLHTNENNTITKVTEQLKEFFNNINLDHLNNVIE